LAEQYLDQMKNIYDPAQRALWNSGDRLFHRQTSGNDGRCANGQDRRRARQFDGPA
jgi:hypothetical protein